MEEDKILDENQITEEIKQEDEKAKRASSPISSNSSGSDDSSESSGDEKEKSKNSPAKRGSASKSPRRPSKSKSLSKEKQRSLSRSASRDGSDRGKDVRERAKKYRNDEKFEYKSQSRGGYQRYKDRDHRDSRSRSRSRSPHDRRFSDRKKTIIYTPTLEGPLLSYRQFMESQKYDIDPSKAEKVYQRYKTGYEEKQNQIFFQEHRHDEWFKEKFDVILSERLKEEQRAEARANAEKFIHNFKNGVFDTLNLNYEDYAYKSQITEFTPKVNSEQMEEDKEVDKTSNNFTEINLEANVDISGSPFFGFDPNSLTLFIKLIPRHVSRWDLLEAFKKLEGFSSLSLSEPLKSQEFIRFGWILFDTEDNCNKACEYLKSLNIKGYAFQVVKSRSQKKSIKICENVDKERILTNLELSKQLIEALDEEKDIRGNPIVKNIDQTDPAKQLDLQVLYLRRVHAYCFYSAAEYADERMLVAKCGSILLRRQKVQKDETVPDLPDWHKRIAEIIKTRISECSRKPRRTVEEIEKKAEEDFDKELRVKCEKVSLKHGNWPCKYCQKIFKEDHFVMKHIKTKHPEKFEQIRENKMYENFASSKNKIFTSHAGGHSHRGYQRSQGPSGGRRFNNQRGGYGSRPNRSNVAYRDLDDPKVAQVRGSRTVVDYSDL